MLDHRISSTGSSPPGHPTAIARPTWPWQASPLRFASSSSPDYRPSLSHSTSSRSISSVGAHTSSPVNWQSTPRPGPSSTMGSASNSQEDTTRQWTFMVRNCSGTTLLTNASTGFRMGRSRCPQVEELCRRLGYDRRDPWSQL
jgi:hypothetical protein